jgi:IstB-like ATP binding protein.
MDTQASTATRRPLSEQFICPESSKALAEQLYAGDFLARGENVIIASPPGCAKGYFATLIARANGKASFRITVYRDLLGADLEERIVLVDGELTKPTTKHGLRPDLVDCDVLIVDGVPEPAIQPSLCEQFEKLLRERALAGRSTIVLITVFCGVDKNVFAQRFPTAHADATWHVLELGYLDRETELKLLANRDWALGRKFV